MLYIDILCASYALFNDRLEFREKPLHRPTILIIEDDCHVQEILKNILKDNYFVLEAATGEKGIELLENNHVDLILLDLNLPTIDGIKTLELIKEFSKEIGVIIITGYNDAKSATSTLKRGAYDYIVKPFDYAELLSVIDNYFKKTASNKIEFDGIKSKNHKVLKIFDFILSIGRADTTILITGESGTGKELIARAIHNASDRKDKPFVAINCGALPCELIESELFGHEKGAFSGAYSIKIGKFEYANGGTIFLDEIGTLPLSLQVKLLRVLQEKSFERVGSNTIIRLDVRFIAATNAKLEEEIKKGRFREDLYFRLNVIPIELPPLRERKEDIIPLATYFLKNFNLKHKKSIEIDEKALKVLEGYAWPGNIRELENIIERLVVTNSSQITLKSLPDEIYVNFVFDSYSKLKETQKLSERNHILATLKANHWNKSKTADELGIHRNTLIKKIKELQIEEKDFN